VPELLPGLGLFMNAFLQLLPYRRETIAFADVEAYCRMFGVPASHFEPMLVNVKALEAEFVEWERSKPEQPDGSPLDALIAKRKAQGRIR
jgi:hypothetical protein